jgi:heme-degrading monooxygenase HmoA
VIVRVYRAWVKAGLEAPYLALLEETVVPAARTTEGLVAWHVGRRMDGRAAEFVIVTVWRDLASIEAVTGGDWQQPIFFSSEETMIERSTVEHYEGVGGLPVE